MRERFMVDYHLHTSRCGHGVGSMREYVERAVELGLTEIGFADHFPLLDRRDPSLTMSLEDLPGYLDEIDALKNEFSSLSIRRGIEADFIPEVVEKTAELLKRYRFDYVIGSVHFLGGWGFDDPREKGGYAGREPIRVYEKYFQTLEAAARSGIFDIIAHPDLIKKYDYRPGMKIDHLYESAARAIAESGAAVEVNTAGLRKPVGEIYPALEFLRHCSSSGIPVIFGSDAHEPADVGRDLDLALKLARDAGYRQMARFEERVMTLVDIPHGRGVFGGE